MNTLTHRERVAYAIFTSIHQGFFKSDSRTAVYFNSGKEIRLLKTDGIGNVSRATYLSRIRRSSAVKGRPISFVGMVPADAGNYHVSSRGSHPPLIVFLVRMKICWHRFQLSTQAALRHLRVERNLIVFLNITLQCFFG